MTDERKIRRIKPNEIKLNNSPHSRTPNSASPVGSPTPSGNLLNSDKDYSKWSETPPEEVNRIHTRDDVDKNSLAHHHTLGPKRGQASPGDHIHTGTTSKKLGAGMGLTLTGSKGGNAALASLIILLKNFIEVTDTTT